MKKACLFILLSFSFLVIQAQSKKELAVKVVVNKLIAAMISGDRSELESVSSARLSYGHSGGHVEGKIEFVEKIASGKSDFVTIDITEQTIEIVGNTAMVRHTFNATTYDGGKPGVVKLKILLIFHLEKGDWKLLARQAVKVESPQSNSKQPIVLLDAYYNNEIKKDSLGNDIRWHYAWEELSNGGFSLLGKQFQKKGAQLKTLLTVPTALSLGTAAVYLIVDPDNSKDNPSPNYMNATDASVISDWVKAGGVLVLLANDSANCDLIHFNILAEKFGIQFTNESVNMVKGNAFEMGVAFPVQGNGVLTYGTKLFVKDVSALQLEMGAKAIVMSGDKTIAAMAAYGKGQVIAVGDPWLYNEYVDGKKLSADYQNFEAMEQLVNWVMAKAF
jgi:unsaturated rhamnogalacturonyl hydrolase